MIFSDARISDTALAAKFDFIRSTDPAELTCSSRFSARLRTPGQLYRYHLRDRAMWRMRFDEPIFTMAERSAGAILVTYAQSRFSTEVALDGDDSPNFCISIPQQGELTMIRGGIVTTGTEARGLVSRHGPRTRWLFGDANLRAQVFVKVQEVEAALRHALDRDLRQPLEFAPGLEWTSGLAASFKRQLDAVLTEFQSPDGVADNPVALAATTDLLVTLLLQAAPHTYSDQLEIGTPCAVPAYVRRAEAFMRANGAEPIRITQVAAAAGCSVRNLNGVFRRFRGTTPMAALRAIRLDSVRDALLTGGTGASAAAVARRHGFTNLARFAALYRRRFGEAPSEAARRAARG